jgi:hypothetical protein
MKLIGLCGQKGSGKTTVANMIRELRPGTALIAFADPLKEFCSKVLDWPREALEDGDYKETPDERYQMPDGGDYLTPRIAFQKLGTEWGRACYPNVWVDYGMRRAREALDPKLTRRGHPGPASLVVFTDVRFVNEAKAITEEGGEVWRIVRGMDRSTDTHPSETEMLSPQMDRCVVHEVNNNTRLTLPELRGKVAALLEES